MTVPQEYAHASQVFDRFLDDMRVALGHGTSHQTYQTVESVLRVFRRRLTVDEALVFAAALPAVLRAIFVMDWDIHEPRREFFSRESLGREVQDFRKNHDFSPDNAIAVMASVLRRHVDPLAFDLALSKLPPKAREFWEPA
ncbi:hypothetical protein GCM10007276_33220 [Agaricicola taiwanensis]|uniref:DUF2267 domain-containing protein n=1 Tax=Agaricicola taiwanensis TaxID=591372 RepID=A0A8J2YMD0_9RHOB|nr:DUF2267 domain-containing protein [Agaricicola taiwanensis]GGE53556.1 hypothetical protein GCM10007276_33220 [Agaricicola taiwanensis]